MRPQILLSPHTEPRSSEFPDDALSLSRAYTDAVQAAGGLPLVLPPFSTPEVVRTAVARCDGVLLSGGDDVDPQLHSPGLTPELRATVFPVVGGRDLFELVLIDEAFRRAKPLLAICRGQQILNVALGGDLIIDLPLQRPDAPGHSQCERRFELVHEIDIEPDSGLARLTGVTRLGVNSTHHQAIGRVAPPLRAVARCPHGVIEALELRPEARAGVPFLLGVQFHPERLADRHAPHAAIFRGFVEACGAAANRR